MSYIMNTLIEKKFDELKDLQESLMSIEESIEDLMDDISLSTYQNFFRNELDFNLYFTSKMKKISKIFGGVNFIALSLWCC